MPVIPTVIESDGRAERAFDIYSRLLRDRIVFLGREVDDEIANLIVAQLLLLEADDPERDIALYVNSPGGSAYAGMAIYDAMQHVRPDVSTICFGMGMSAAAMIMAGGAAGKRFALPNAKLMIHQGSAGFRGAPSDIQIAAREVAATTRQMAEIIGRHAGRDVETVMEDIDRDRFMTPAEAVEYGLVDAVLPPPVPTGREVASASWTSSGIHHVGVAVDRPRRGRRRRTRACSAATLEHRDARARPGRRGRLRARRRQPDRAARADRRRHARRPLPRQARARASTTSPTRSTTSAAALGELAAEGVELIDTAPAPRALRPAGRLCPSRRRPRRPHGGRIRCPTSPDSVRIEVAFAGGPTIAANVSPGERRRARARARRRARRERTSSTPTTAAPRSCSAGWRT